MVKGFGVHRSLSSSAGRETHIVPGSPYCSGRGLVRLFVVETGAAFGGQVRHPTVHHVGTGKAMEAPAPAPLFHQPGPGQPGDVVRQGGGRNLQAALEVADHHAGGTGPDQQPEYRQPGRTAQLGQAFSRIFFVHGDSVDQGFPYINDNSRNIEIIEI